MRAPSTIDPRSEQAEPSEVAPEPDLILVVVWAAKEPERIGEALRLPPGQRGPFVFGRGHAQPDERYERVDLVRRRPGADAATPPLENPFLSRQHLKLTRQDEELRLELLGKRPLLVNGVEVAEAQVGEGDVVEIKKLLAFLCVRRPSPLPALLHGEDPPPAAFGGEVDAFVGESAVAWQLRDRVAFVAARDAHVLVTGASGTGKELIAGSIHAMSRRSARKLVARSAATLPSGLIDAELFGNVGNYPNAGMPERQGLVGEADGSTLFLDEIGELPAELQTHLLRVLDRAGEYQRLGEGRRRQADLRLVAATNRAAEDLKHDLVARLPLRVHAPGLQERREDIPLVARHLLRRIATDDRAVGVRFFEDWPQRQALPRMAQELVVALVTHRYTAHVRELEALLWRSIESSPGSHLALTDSVREALSPSAPAAHPGEGDDEVTAASVRAALAKHGGVRELAWRELGLASRHVLHRLMKKYGIAARD